MLPEYISRWMQVFAALDWNIVEQLQILPNHIIFLQGAQFSPQGEFQREKNTARKYAAKRQCQGQSWMDRATSTDTIVGWDATRRDVLRIIGQATANKSSLRGQTFPPVCATGRWGGRKQLRYQLRSLPPLTRCHIWQSSVQKDHLGI